MWTLLVLTFGPVNMDFTLVLVRQATNKDESVSSKRWEWFSEKRTQQLDK